MLKVVEPRSNAFAAGDDAPVPPRHGVPAVMFVALTLPFAAAVIQAGVLIERYDTHLGSLAQRLREPRVSR